jgi:diguanylate cyclase (GGDEF)-like protein/PAS domain S-box-containing protein
MKDEKRTKNDLLRELRELREQTRLLETLSITPQGTDASLSLQTLLDAIQEGVTLMDRDLAVVLTNAAVERWYAHAVPLLGRKCYDAFLGRSERCHDCPAQAALDTGKPQSYETQRQGPEGPDGWLEVHVSPLFDSSGQAVAVLEYARDITKRKLAEQAMARSEENYRLLVENQAGVVVKFDAQGNILFASPGLCRVLGRTEGELIGAHYGPFVHPEDRPGAEAGFQNLFEPPHSLDVQVRIMTASGWRWYALNQRAVLDASGQLAEVVCTGRDIDEQKRAEATLRESEARFRAIFDSAAAGIALAGPDGGIVQVNRKFQDMLGYEPAEVMGLKAEDFAYPEEREASAENTRQALAAMPEGYRIEKRYRRKDGSAIWVDLSVSPILDAGGRVAALLAVILDITESYKVRTALAEMDSILENSLVGILVMRRRTVLRANTRLADMFGYSPEEVMGKNARLFHVSDRHYDEFGQVYLSRLNRTQFTNIEYPFRRKDGREIWCRVAGKAIDPADMDRGVVWCLEDVTEEKKAQQALRQYAKDLFRTKQQVEESARRLASMIQELDDKNARLEEEVAERRRVEEALRDSERRYRELSLRDELTGLFNTRHFFEQAEAELRRTNRYGHPLSLLFIDLDNFKKFNDTHGHLAGDKVLAGLGEVLASSIRDTDLAFRYGGEEFVVLLPETAGPEALRQAERVREAFARRTAEAGTAQTLSMGVAQYVQGEGLRDFIHRADQAMYKAKHSGKDCCQLAE